MPRVLTTNDTYLIRTQQLRNITLVCDRAFLWSDGAVKGERWCSVTVCVSEDEEIV